MAKKKEVSLEELLELALIEDENSPHDLPQNWIRIRLPYAYSNLTSSKKKIQQKDYLSEGQYAIVDQGQELIGGYTNESGYLFDGELPVVIFGDHTRNVKFIDFPFAQGADGVKVLKANNINDKFFYYQLMNLDIPNLGYRRHFPLFPQYSFVLPPLPEQRRIVDLIESLFEKLDRAKELVQNSIDSFEVRKSAILHNAYIGELTSKWRENNNLEYEWEETEIRHLVKDLNQGWSPKCENYPTTDFENWGVIKTTAIQHLEFIEGENKQLPSNLIPREKHELKVGDILITRAGPRVRVGVCCLIKNLRPRLLLCDKAYRFRANLKRVLPEYLVIVLNTPDILEQINLIKTGISESGVNLTQDGFMAIKIMVPPIHEQKEIIRIVNTLLENEEKAMELIKVIDNIDLLKKSVLARAFRGQLNTNNPDEESALKLLKEVLRERVVG